LSSLKSTKQEANRKSDAEKTMALEI